MISKKILRVDKMNKNGYTIPREEIEDYLENRYDGKDILCTSDPYQNRLSNITHIIKDLKLDGDFLVADINVIDPALIEMIKNPHTKFGASYQAKTDKDSGKVSNIDYIKCFPTMELSFDDEENKEISPCITCGMDWSDDTIDILYPQNREKTSYVFGCMTHNGGCGRHVYAGSVEKVIERWNKGEIDEWII